MLDTFDLIPDDLKGNVMDARLVNRWFYNEDMQRRKARWLIVQYRDLGETRVPMAWCTVARTWIEDKSVTRMVFKGFTLSKPV